MPRTTHTDAAPRAQTATSRQAALATLRHNQGFAEPERWVEYALGHSFSWVRAIPVPTCPDCDAPPRGRLGQYVHYSTLLQLLECAACGLIWASARLDPAVIRGHFEQAYKGEEYFAARADIFGQLVCEISRHTPDGGRVLDVGGAQGHLMHRLRQVRPDVAVVVQDLSREAVRHARERFGLETVCGPLHQLARHHRQYDVVVLSDVLYYEPRLPDCWRLLPSLVAPGGSVVIRVPNKLPLIQMTQAWRRCVAPDPLQDRIRYFNPDHIYLLTRRYLTRRLVQVGFGAVRVLPSPPLRPRGRWRHVAGRMLFAAASVVARLTGGRVILTPSQVLVAAR
jgi:SAM-dependent methyltransferase